jgi:GH24 family phage-related lysozyme (muramidase)
LLGYDHAAGKVVKGLIRRRQAEYVMCMRND